MLEITLNSELAGALNVSMASDRKCYIYSNSIVVVSEDSTFGKAYNVYNVLLNQKTYYTHGCSPEIPSEFIDAMMTGPIIPIEFHPTLLARMITNKKIDGSQITKSLLALGYPVGDYKLTRNYLTDGLIVQKKAEADSFTTFEEFMSVMGDQ